MRPFVAVCVFLSMGSLSCSTDAGSANGELVTQSGPFSGTLQASPLEVGLNHAELDLLDADGTPLAGAVVTISPWMPAHGHGTETVDADALAVAGAYGSDRVRFQMGGVWQLRVHVLRGSDEGDLVATIEVP